MDQPDARTTQAQVTSGRRHHDRVLVVILVVALVGAGYFTYRQYDDHRAHDRTGNFRTEAIETASDIAVDLATISPATAKADIEALAARGTPEFASQIRSNLDGQVDLITDNKVKSSGEVTGAGIVELKSSSATVAVALRSEVTNGATGGAAEERFYRMTVALKRTDGEWFASEVVFIQ